MRGIRDLAAIAPVVAARTLGPDHTIGEVAPPLKAAEPGVGIAACAAGIYAVGKPGLRPRGRRRGRRVTDADPPGDSRRVYFKSRQQPFFCSTLPIRLEWSLGALNLYGEPAIGPGNGERRLGQAYCSRNGSGIIASSSPCNKSFSKFRSGKLRYLVGPEECVTPCIGL